VTLTRDHDWLVRMIREPEKMMAEKDPIATALYEKYKQVKMPRLPVGNEDMAALMKFLESQDRKIDGWRSGRSRRSKRSLERSRRKPPSNKIQAGRFASTSPGSGQGLCYAGSGPSLNVMSSYWLDFEFDFTLDASTLLPYIAAIEACEPAASFQIVPPEWREKSFAETEANLRQTMIEHKDPIENELRIRKLALVLGQCRKDA